MPRSVGRRVLLSAALGLGAGLLSSCVADPNSPTSPQTPNQTPSSSPSSAPNPTASPTPAPSPTATPESASSVPSRKQVLNSYPGRPAGAFGLEVKGIALGLPSKAKGAALTFDACGGANGEGFDEVLIEVLRKNKAPATLFINQRWAKANKSLTRELAADPLFEIANHGTTHAPLASRGQAAYGIPGTANIGAAYDEIMGNQRYLSDEFGVEAKFFRSGTAHMDELSAALTREIGLIPMNFTVNLDAGATFPAATVGTQTLSMRARSVGIGHFNRPKSGTGKGVAEALPRLIQALDSQSLRLLKLSDAF
ncbi:polysaccharide deacetylase family protein [Arthrobacter sp. MYb227]|uniref:polysaccharide deacetylase family protein n=1 Tax=Arthrobacter sp. MYb227 TaxID=1848601 RepID=UPI002158073B|nr:polysaccharide deacetylase family protein [Arthrobacter sp. MYb227]